MINIELGGMKINRYILSSSIIFLTLLSCKSEDPFSYEIEEGLGRILTSGLSLEVISEETATRATQLPSVKDFTVSFCKADSPTEPFEIYSYDELPEVVILPVGEYVVQAFYGDDNIIAAFDTPAYFGQSDSFKVEEGRIVDFKDPIVCTLYNVRVSVDFDDELRAVMGDDVVVSVQVGENGILEFTPDNESDGFFKFDEDSYTLAATFKGTVNDVEITEIKNYDKITRGTYYKLTFKLRGVEIEKDPSNGSSVDNNQGSASGGLMIDATVIFHDHSSDGGHNVDPDKEEYLTDERYPNIDDPQEGPNDEPQIPDNPETTPGKPQLVSDDVDLKTTTDISNWPEGQSLAVKILTPTGLTKFVCTIESSQLDAEALEGVGLQSRLDLINDTELFEKLSALGFPVGDEITNPQVKGDDGNYVITFDITQFVTLLNALGSGTHNFIFDLVNEAGETIETLKLKS